MRARIRACVPVLVFALAVSARAAAAVEHEVRFTVANLNRSIVPCLTDQATSYTIEGHLVLPDGPLPSTVTLYLHGLGFGEWFWRFPGADFAADMAARGHASVVVDRLGYGASTQPDGLQSCLGGQADIAHQIISQLKSGTYAVTGGSATSFSRVALAGHSAGGAIAQIEAYSPDLGDIDALVVLAYADLGASLLTLQAFGGGAQECVAGILGLSTQPGYASFGRTDADFQALMFADADPGVVAAATAMRSKDPCGEDGSFPQAIVLNALLARTVTVPVLLLCGGSDAVFPPPACDNQQLLVYGGTAELVTIPGLGHALTLENARADVIDALSSWLAARGF